VDTSWDDALAELKDLAATAPTFCTNAAAFASQFISDCRTFDVIIEGKDLCLVWRHRFLVTAVLRFFRTGPKTIQFFTLNPCPAAGFGAEFDRPESFRQ
jgi:hypothetical protein